MKYIIIILILSLEYNSGRLSNLIKPNSHKHHFLLDVLNINEVGWRLAKMFLAFSWWKLNIMNSNFLSIIRNCFGQHVTSFYWHELNYSWIEFKLQLAYALIIIWILKNIFLLWKCSFIINEFSVLLHIKFHKVENNFRRNNFLACLSL